VVLVVVPNQAEQVRLEHLIKVLQAATVEVAISMLVVAAVLVVSVKTALLVRPVAVLVVSAFRRLSPAVLLVVAVAAAAQTTAQELAVVEQEARAQAQRTQVAVAAVKQAVAA